jgi:hypothetical protein
VDVLCCIFLIPLPENLKKRHEDPRFEAGFLGLDIELLAMQRKELP